VKVFTSASSFKKLQVSYAEISAYREEKCSQAGRKRIIQIIQKLKRKYFFMKTRKIKQNF